MSNNIDLQVCEDAIIDYCSVPTSIDDNYDINEIIDCLNDHIDDLNTECENLINSIDNNDPKSDSDLINQNFLEVRNRILTFMITFVSILILFIYIYGFIWAYKKWNKFEKISNNMIYNNNKKNNNNILKKNKKKKIRKKGKYKNLNDISNEINDIEENIDNINISINNNIENENINNKKSIKISFAFISFWITLNRNWKKDPFEVKKKQILKNVSGIFEENKLTGIMGPSGSGKTTLLNLISGHIFKGNFCGLRFLNNKLLTKSSYDLYMRKQGYVRQTELFYNTLTVWDMIKYEAMLRLPKNLSMELKLKRAKEVLIEVGLEKSMNSIIGSNDKNGGISGGQKRRLSISLEMLSLPNVLYLDEPTSGLGSFQSLQLISLLHVQSHLNNRTIITTIHQPRKEIFDKFDNLLLLGEGGEITYHGPANKVESFLNLAPCVHINSNNYDNVADFIIDALGLSTNEEKERLNEEKKLYNRLIKEEQFIENENNIDNNNIIIIDNEEKKYDDIIIKNNNKNEEIKKDNNNNNKIKELFGKNNNIYNLSLSQLYRHSTYYFSIIENIVNDSKNDLENIIKMKNNNNNNNNDNNETFLNQLKTINGIKNIWKNYFKFDKYELWILFGRRMRLLLTDHTTHISQIFQIIFIGSIISIAFTYDVDSAIELPYQVFMLILILSSYAFILQYLQLVPEYLDERNIINSSRLSKIISYPSYILSAALTETPRALIHSLFLSIIVYSIHGLNPDPIKILFFFVCLSIGVNAWQSVISLCASLTNDINLVYSIVFLTLGGGTLFGGLLISYEHISLIFKPIYYISTTAVTTRALLVNDFLCCYLTSDCTNLFTSTSAEDMIEAEEESRQNNRFLYNYNYDINDIMINLSNQTSNNTIDTCPIQLQEYFANEERGNLGRFALDKLGLDNVDNYVELFTLFMVSIFARYFAIGIYYLREWLNENLNEIYKNKTKDILIDLHTINFKKIKKNDLIKRLDINLDINQVIFDFDTNMNNINNIENDNNINEEKKEIEMIER